MRAHAELIQIDVFPPSTQDGHMTGMHLNDHVNATTRSEPPKSELLESKVTMKYAVTNPRHAIVAEGLWARVWRMQQPTYQNCEWIDLARPREQVSR